jgi:hypothetical protein
MRLSAEMYDQIVAALRSDKQRDKDKRKEPRVGLAGEANLVAVSETGVRISGVTRVRDISPTGIGLIFNKQLAKGQRFVVQLEGFDGQPVWLVATTAYCRTIDNTKHSIGAKIQQVLRADQIQKIEDKATAATAASAAVNAPRRPATLAPTAAPAAATSDIARISKAILG